MDARFKLPRVDDYEALIGSDAVARLKEKARALRGMRVVHMSSTYYGGGVAEMLAPLTLLMSSLGIPTGWRLVRGTPEFFGFTKTLHNALQGGAVQPSQWRTDIYEQVVCENAARNPLEDDRDVVVVHDPQPLALIEHCRKQAPWIWRCHIDLSAPDPLAWSYVRRFIERYDAAIFSCPEYAQDLRVPQRFMLPAIHPFNLKNRELDAGAVDRCLARHGIPTDLPLVVQISRFDRWKDPRGVVEAFRIARRQIDATLVLLGNFAPDDPEGEAMYHELLALREPRILVLARDDDELVNCLQRRAAVVLQKSLREGFGLTVTEAMWKAAPVIGGNAGGIPRQIDHGENGFLVASVEEAAERIVELLRDPQLRLHMGRAGREKARSRFLLTRYLEQYLDLFAALRGVRLPKAA